MLLLNPAGGLIACDAAGRQALESKDGEVLLKALAALPPIGRASRQWFRVDGPSGHMAFMLRVSELVNGRPEPSYRSVTLYEPAGEIRADSDLLRAAFRFTPAEMRLALDLLAGRTAQEAAKSADVSIHTVRTYLKRLYRKVGVRSQPSLLVKMLQTTRVLPTDADHGRAAGGD